MRGEIINRIRGCVRSCSLRRLTCVTRREIPRLQIASFSDCLAARFRIMVTANAALCMRPKRIQSSCASSAKPKCWISSKGPKRGCRPRRIPERILKSKRRKCRTGVLPFRPVPAAQLMWRRPAFPSGGCRWNSGPSPSVLGNLCDHELYRIQAGNCDVELFAARGFGKSVRPECDGGLSRCSNPGADRGTS